MASSPTRGRIDPRSELAMRTCPTEKVRFEHYFQAFDAAEFMMDKGLVNPGCHQTPVPCAICRGWHVCNRVIVFRRDDLELDDLTPTNRTNGA